MDFDYDFEKTPTETKTRKSKKSPRPNYRLSISCSNCKYFEYHGKTSKKGYCAINANKKTVKWGNLNRTSVNWEEINWAKTHMTCLCDNHRYRSVAHSFKTVEKWTNSTIDKTTKHMRKQC